jgi:hypothetical protein
MEFFFTPPAPQLITKGLEEISRPKAVVASLCLAFATIGMAQSMEPGIELAQLPPPYSSEMFLTPFRYIAPAGAPGNATKTDTEADGPQRPTEQQRIVDLSTQGNYAVAGTEGLTLLSKEKADDPLQLIIANSLAWSGRLKEATSTYQKITDTELVDDANVGIANILRWQGRDELAAPIYRRVLATRAEHKDALSGLELAERELVPKTTITFGTAGDSSNTDRRAVTLNHRWRDDSGSNIYEVETSGIKDSLPGVEADQRDITVRYQALGLELKPALELSVANAPQSTVFGSLKFLFDEDRVQVALGSVNWGRLANNANALLSNLTASHFGASAKRETSLGNVAGRLDYYVISDTNTILSSDVKLNSNLRPLGNNIKPFIGFETRKANFLSSNYWSPNDGAGSLYVGLLAEWGSDDWSLYASGQSGMGLYGEAGTSWSLSGGAKRWVSRNTALSVNAWSMSSSRLNSEYRAQTVNIALEKLWR